MPVEYIPHPIKADAYDLIATRALNVNYQNTTLRPISVQVTVQFNIVAAAQARAILYIDPTTPPANASAYCGYLTAPIGVVFHGYMEILVPPGWYYRVQPFVGGGNVAALNEWWEIHL